MEEKNDSLGSGYGSGSGGTSTPGTPMPGVADTPSFGAAGSTGSEKFGSTSGAVDSSGDSGSSGGVQERANQAMDQAADKIGQAADRLNQFADQQGGGGSGMKGKAGEVSHRAADAMESTARYLRDNDVQRLQGDLEGMVRSNPLQTLLVGAAAGWIVGKILR